MSKHKDIQTSERVAAFRGATFPFGLALLLAAGWVWPGILLLVLITAVPVVIAEEGMFGAWILAQATVWLVGMAVLLTRGCVWPGVLVLAGISALIVAIVPPDPLEARQKQMRANRSAKPKRKRDTPLPHIAERLDELETTGEQVANNGFEPDDPLYHETGQASRHDM